MSGIDLRTLRDRFADLAVEVAESPESGSGELRLRVDADHAATLLERLYSEEGVALRRLVDLTAIDRGAGADPRFEVVYRLDSPAFSAAVRVHAVLASAAAPSLASVTSIWPAARWLEREVYDLFGIEFVGHPALRRLLLPSDFEGAPLRRDAVQGAFE